MKNKNLFIKNMVIIILPLLVISIALLMISKAVIEDYFREESYQILDRELSVFKSNQDGNPADENNIRDNIIKNTQERLLEGVNTGDLLKPGKMAQSTFFFRTKEGRYKFVGGSSKLLNLNLDGLASNEVWPFRGETELENEKIFYAVIPLEGKKIPDTIKLGNGSENYHLAYISESYSLQLTQSVMLVFVIGLTILIVLVLSVLFFVFRNISHRLSSLEKGANHIGRGDFNADLIVEPFDEIGRLGEAMNHMGKQLSLYQEEQSENFQMISHELKTPIMVMQGYLDAMIHNQYPSGSKEKTMVILTQELDKLEKLTKDILVINKMDYLAKNMVSIKTLHLSEHFKIITDLLNHESSIQISITGEHTLMGDEESWHRIIENIISNSLRYAKSKIDITLGEKIIIKNDGESIETHLMDKIMKPFVKGKSGRSGLGLTIVANTLKLYHYTLKLHNEIDGVSYIISKETE